MNYRNAWDSVKYHSARILENTGNVMHKGVVVPAALASVFSFAGPAECSGIYNTLGVGYWENKGCPEAPAPEGRTTKDAGLLLETGYDNDGFRTGVAVTPKHRTTSEHQEVDSGRVPSNSDSFGLGLYGTLGCITIGGRCISAGAGAQRGFSGNWKPGVMAGFSSDFPGNEDWPEIGIRAEAAPGSFMAYFTLTFD